MQRCFICIIVVSVQKQLAILNNLQKIYNLNQFLKYFTIYNTISLEIKSSFTVKDIKLKTLEF
jgi:hypothetical protein